MYTQARVESPAVSLQPAPVVLWREALAMLACVGMLSVGNIGALLTGGALALWSLRNSTAALQALSILVLVTSLNTRLSPVVFPGMIKWLVLLIALGSAIYHCLKNNRRANNTSVPSWLLTLSLFAVVTLLLSLVSSSSAELSIFKLITFAVGVCGVMAIFADPTVSLRYCLSWFTTLFTVVVCASLPFIGSTSGFLQGTQYFTGIMLHSQLLGIFLAPFIVYGLARWLFAVPLISRLEKVVCLLALIMLYLTSSRTAGFTVLLSLVVLLAWEYLRNTAHRRLVVRAILLGGMLMLALVAVDMTTGGGLVNRLQTYMQKRGDINTSILSSRETKFNEAFHTFRGHMLSGVGFGMPVNEYDVPVVERDPILHLPLSAPVEASVIYMALPAQVGLLGVLPFLAFIAALARPVLRYAPLPIIGLSLSVFLTNFGEYTFFSFGSIGLLWWLVFALSYAYGVQAGGERDS